MIIQIALGIVLAVLILVAIVVGGYVLFVTFTKHREISDGYLDVEEWFRSENFADKLDNRKGGRR